MSEISKEQKQKFKDLVEQKKNIIEQLLSLNYRLDTFRVSLTLLINNIYSSKKLTIPDFDYAQASKLVNDFGALLIGAEKDYQFKNSTNSAVAAETAGSSKKETYPSDYANPNSKNYEGDK